MFFCTISQSAIVPQGMDKGAECAMKFLWQVFAWRDINGGYGECLCPYNGDRGRETALPCPHHLGTAGINMNPLAGKRGYGTAVSLQSGVGKRHCRILIISAQPELIFIPLRGKEETAVPYRYDRSG